MSKKISFENHDDFYDFFVDNDGEFDEKVSYKHEDKIYEFDESQYNYLLKEYGKDVKYCVAENNIEHMLSSRIIKIKNE